MILLIAVLIGLAAGLLRARLAKRTYQPVGLRAAWLVVVAFLPQFLLFNFGPTRTIAPDELVPWVLVGSQVLLLVFAWLNRRKAGFWLLGLGLGMNFLVIVLNGGMMPISPETVQRLIPEAPAGFWEIGQRLGVGKDVVLPVAETRLWWLSDWLTLPAWIPYRVAFSPGDILIAAGTIWVLWSLGGIQPEKEKLR